MKIQIPNLSELNFNGVINIGSKDGHYAKHYYELGLYSALWIDKNLKYDAALYNNTKNIGMKQQYYFTEISNIDSDNTLRFKSFWRANAASIDIETYDLLHLDIKNNHIDVIKSFDNLITNFRAIVITKNHNFELQTFLEQNKFNLESYTGAGHYLYL